MARGDQARPSRSRGWADRAGSTVGPLVLYGALALLFWFTPIAGAPRSTLIAADEIDSGALMWLLAWWPHAVGEGLNPFVTHLAFVPEGYNLTWATSLPGLSLLAAPVTLTLGPVTAWNALALLCPALSAWTAFLLCRHVTGRVGPSVVGGYVYGFSPYMLSHITGAPHLAMVALLPVAVLVVLRRVEGTLGPRAFVAAMTAVLTGQFLVSTEIFAVGTLFGGVALLAAYGLYPDRRAVLRRTIALLAGAYAATAALVSPYLYYFLFEPHTEAKQALLGFPTDVLSLVIPWHGQALASGHTAQGVPSYTGFTYLGIPLLAILALFAWRYRRTRAARLLVVCLLVPLVAGLGGKLQVGGSSTGIPLPWAVFSELPFLRYAIPVRFILYVLLPAALVVALWLSWERGRAPWVLALAVIVFLVPDVGNALWKTRISNPSFLEDGRYRAYLEPGDRILAVPIWGQTMRWQADAGFPFALAGGYLGAFPESYLRYPTFRTTLLTGRLTPDYGPQLRRFVRDKGVTAIVVDARGAGPWRQLFGTLGVRPVETGEVLFYRLRRPTDRQSTRVR